MRHNTAKLDTRQTPCLTLRTVRLVFALAGALLFLAFAARLSPAQSLQPGGPTDFGSNQIGVSSQVTLTFSAGVTTTISSVVATTAGATGQDFTVAKQNCVGTLSPPMSCSITLSFTPSQIGLRSGYLAIADGTGTVVNHVYLRGIGIGAQLVYTPNAVTTLSSSSALSPANFSPGAAVLDGYGNLYFDDIANGRILEQTPTGAISQIGFVPVSAQSSMAIDGQGKLYISSPSTAAIYVIAPGTPVTTLATGVALVTPTGLATDGIGYLYIADAGAGNIIRVALDGSGVTPLSFTGLNTPLSNPQGLAVDAANNLYIADAGNDRIVTAGLYTGAAKVATISGLTLNNPSGLVVDGAGTLTIADTGNSRYVVAPPSLPAFALPVPGVTLATPAAAVLKGNGDLLLADTTVGLISVVRSSLTLNFPTPTKVGTVDSTDGIMTFTIQNTGSMALELPIPTSGGTDPAISSKSFSDSVSGNTCPRLNGLSSPTSNNQLALGYRCAYAVEFTPTVTGVNSASFTITAIDAAGSGVTIMPSIPLVGTGTSDLASFTVVASPTVTAVGAPVGFTVTALNAAGTPATDYLGTVTFGSGGGGKFLSGTSYTFTSTDAGVHTFPAAGGVAFYQVGTFTIQASDNNISAVSNPITVLSGATVAITSSLNPVLLSNNTTLTCSVTATGAAPTGSVIFYDGTNSLGTVNLTAGVATLPVAFTTTGTHAITAAYSGDANYAPSTSSPYLETVDDFAISLAANSSGIASVPRGTAATYTLSITPVGGSTFPANVALSVTGLPANIPYTLSPSSFAAGSGATTFTLTVTPPLNLALEHAPEPAAHSTGRVAAFALALFLLPAAWLRRRRLLPVALLLLLGVSLSGLTGCLSNTNGGYYIDTPASYTVTITATSGELSHSAVVTLNVK